MRFIFLLYCILLKNGAQRIRLILNEKGKSQRQKTNLVKGEIPQIGCHNVDLLLYPNSDNDQYIKNKLRVNKLQIARKASQMKCVRTITILLLYLTVVQI